MGTRRTRAQFPPSKSDKQNIEGAFTADDVVVAAAVVVVVVVVVVVMVVV